MIFCSILLLIVAFAIPYINKDLDSSHFLRIATISFIYAGALAFNAFYIQSIGSGIGIYSGLFHITLISQLFDSFLFLIGSLILIGWPKLINRSALSPLSTGEGKTEVRPQILSNTKASEYSLIVLFSTLGGSLLISSADLISMYLSIELQSFGVYILSTIYRESDSATSAGLKYFLLGGLASCLILLGCGIIYTFTGLTNFESIYSLISVCYNTQIIIGLCLGLVILVIGFLIKIAAAPLHNWSIDVYDDSPTIVTIWLTIMPKISIVLFLLELHTHILNIDILNNDLLSQMIGGIDYINLASTATHSHNIIELTNTVFSLDTNYNITKIFKNVLLISSLLSLIIGTVVGLAQVKIKRLLAYSTVSHIGFILLALAVNTEQSVESLIFYIIQYSITNLNTFLIILAFGYLLNNNLTYKLFNEEDKNSNSVKNTTGSVDLYIKFISELKGQFYLHPFLSVGLIICLFSMAGRLKNAQSPSIVFKVYA